MNQATQLFDEAQAAGEAKLRAFLRPYMRRADKLGFKAFFNVEPEMIVANGTTIPARCVTIELRPVSLKAKQFMHDVGGTAIRGVDRYVELEDAEDCIGGAFTVALDVAAGAR